MYGCKDSEPVFDPADFDVPELTTENSIIVDVNLFVRQGFAFEAQGEKIAVDWGDGTLEKYYMLDEDSKGCHHVYAEEGVYQIKIWSDHITHLSISSQKDYISDIYFGYAPILTYLSLDNFVGFEHALIDNCPILEHLVLHSWSDLVSLDISKCRELKEFDCVTNKKLATLDLHYNDLLERICINEVGISELDISNNRALKNIEIKRTNITSLSLASNYFVEVLSIPRNKLTSLTIPHQNSIIELSCYENEFETLPTLTNLGRLQKLVCNNNKLTELDLSNCIDLIHFNCITNELTELDISKNTMIEQLYFGYNLMEKEAIDKIFSDVPESINSSSPNQFHYKDNPGAKEAKLDIILFKGWKIVEQEDIYLNQHDK
ncbi:hypothetical protein D0T85_20765 [Bacteroides sp. 519]|nr:hypothetical protein [Bacteroides sp. 519]